MYSESNRINVMAHTMALNFAKSGPLQSFEGLIKVEVHVST